MNNNNKTTKQISLDDLFRLAESFAKESLSKNGGFNPHLFIYSPEGISIVTVNDASTDEKKEYFADLAQLTCIAVGAEASVLVANAWFRMAPAGTTDLSRKATEHLERTSIVYLLGETYAVKKCKRIPIICSENGNFFGLGDAKIDNLLRSEGRFGSFLPKEVPSAEMRKMAKSMLKAKEIKIQQVKSPSHPMFHMN